MREILILAYYYSKKEEEEILKYVKPQEKTASFVFGLIKVDNIGQLKKQGVLVDIIQLDSGGQDGLSRSLRTNSTSRFIQYDNDLSSVGPVRKKDLYLIQIKGALLMPWKKELDEAKVSILENLQHNVYKVHTEKDLAFLSALDFVIVARELESSDTEVIVRRSLLPGTDVFDSADRVITYDIKVSEDHTADIVKFFVANGATVIASRPGKVRVILKGMDLITEVRKIASVNAIEEFIPPVLHNDKARRSINIDVEAAGGLKGSTPYEGEGQLVGVADTGIDAQHPDLADRIQGVVALGRPGDSSDPAGHGTHVSGSIVGTGKSSQGMIKGIAPKAKLFFQSVLDAAGGLGGLPLDLRDLFQQAYDQGVRVHNNSWGAMAESEYLFNSLEVDQFIHGHKDMLIVISAGNAGTALKPRNSKAGFVDWLSLGSPATAKNALTIGASRSSRASGGFSTLTYGQAWPDTYPDDPMSGQRISGDVECLAGFSSRGPCGNESRIKPDVVAPGTDIASTKSSTAPTSHFWGPYPKNRSYAFMGGTSMSAPIVTGFAVLIREYYTKGAKWKPSAALLKATIVNSTRMLSGSDSLADNAFVPNFHQGFGCVDMKNAIPNDLQPSLKLAFLDSWQEPALQFNGTGERFIFSVAVKATIPLRFCLTWTDPPGRGLQNNINLMVMHKETETKWTGNAELPRTITAFDRDNNVEIIRIDSPQAGEYLIAVQAANIIFSPQDFALVITGDLNSQLKKL